MAWLKAEDDAYLLMSKSSMPHASPDDPEDHSTIKVKDSAGQDVCIGHVTTDPSKQQVRTLLKEQMIPYTDIHKPAR